MARGMKPKKVVGKRGEISWQTRIDLGEDAEGNRIQKRLKAPTKPELEKLITETLSQVNKGTYFEPAKMTVSDYLDYFMDNYGKQHLKPKTYQGYKSIIDKHLKVCFFGDYQISKLLPAHIQKYYTDTLAGGRKDNKKTKGRGLSTTTVLHHARLLHEALEHAVRWEFIARNVAHAVKPPRQARTEVKALTREQADIIREAARGTYLYMPTFLAVSTGMRLGEVLGLRWEDVKLPTKGKKDQDPYLTVTQTLQDTNEGLIFGSPKSKYSRRRIDLFPEVTAELVAHKACQKKERMAAGPAYNDRGLVCCLQEGSPIPIGNFSSYWKNVVKRAGVDAHFHQLRHTAATMMLEAGVPIKQVSEMLGHSSISITADTYGHVTPAGRKDAAKKLGEALFGASK